MTCTCGRARTLDSATWRAGRDIPDVPDVRLSELKPEALLHAIPKQSSLCRESAAGSECSLSSGTTFPLPKGRGRWRPPLCADCCVGVRRHPVLSATLQSARRVAQQTETSGMTPTAFVVHAGNPACTVATWKTVRAEDCLYART